MRAALIARRRAERVASGLDVLVEKRFAPLRGMAVGLICNPTAVDGRLRHAADLFHEARNVRLAVLFGPEHGVRGDIQYMAAVGNERDRRTGVPVHSLYGSSAESLRPDPRILRGLDALVFDIQDVGARYYTYQATMLFCMEAAAREKLAFFVLDRPNPIGGREVEGPALRPGFESFCGVHDVAVRHGLTVGELAAVPGGAGLDLALTVTLPRLAAGNASATPGFRGSFRRNMLTPETASSIRMPEGTNLSGPRHHAAFELFGRRGSCGRLARRSRRIGSRGRFRPVRFVPAWDKHAGSAPGVEVVVVDREVSPFPHRVAWSPPPGPRTGVSDGVRSPTSSWACPRSTSCVARPAGGDERGRGWLGGVGREERAFPEAPYPLSALP
jgi:hypothetical protein